MTTTGSQKKKRPPGSASPIYFLIRGVALILPPVLTLLIIIWVGGMLYDYVIHPVNTAVRYAVARFKYDEQIRTRSELVDPAPGLPSIREWERNYRITPELNQKLRSIYGANRLHSRGTVSEDQLLDDRFIHSIFVPIGKELVPDQFVPLDDYNLVFKHLRPTTPPTTAIGVYMEIAAVREFPTQWHLSLLAVLLTVFALYFVGRLLTARIGRWIFSRFEWMLAGVPFVRNVYSTVKQLTDFVFTEREVELNRVVAVEYPRVGAWSIGFLTGDGLKDCVNSAGEPLVSVLIPASPMPMSGFTVMVPRGSVIDLDLTVDQALQYIVSCGVLLPPNQNSKGLPETPSVLAQSNPLGENAA